MSGTINQPFTRTKLDVPSDRLRSIYRLCEQFPGLEELFDLPKPYEFVTDSNAAIREVLFTSKYRRNESARTDLRESLESGIAKIIAPLELKTEMDRHLPTLALEKGVEVDKLRQDWQELQTYIEFREVVEYELPQTRVADPNDLPFVKLYLSSNADAVLTYDKHISMMGAQALKPDEIRFVRDYARTKAPEVTLRVGGVLIGDVAIGSLIALLKLVVFALRSFLKLPVEYQILVIAGLVLAFLHPATRKGIFNGLYTCFKPKDPGQRFVGGCRRVDCAVRRGSIGVESQPDGFGNENSPKGSTCRLNRASVKRAPRRRLD